MSNQQNLTNLNAIIQHYIQEYKALEKAENTAVKAWTNTKEFEALVAKEDEAPLRFSLMRQASSDMLLELGITTINDILSEATIDCNIMEYPI